MHASYAVRRRPARTGCRQRRTATDSADDEAIAELLHDLGPGRAVAILDRFGADRRRQIALAAGHGEGDRWLAGHNWRQGTVGRLMEPPSAEFGEETTVAQVIETLRPMVSHTLVTYVFVTDAERHLTGLVAFRELAFARPEQRLSEIMVAHPFSLRPEADVIDAMREVVRRHYPVYPVCDKDGHLVGVVRGAVLFEEQAFEISAQAGSMVGVEKEERLTTPWQRALKFRHPWLQLNLVTAFIAAAVVGMFQDTVNRIVILAVFIPVLSGQCSNTGCQALAVTLRGMTLGELKAGRARALLIKEAWLGFLNGALTGVVAAIGMFCAGEPPASSAGLVARRNYLRRDGRQLREFGHRRRCGAARTQAAGCRSGDRVEHLPHHGDGRRQHGPLSRARRMARQRDLSFFTS